MLNEFTRTELLLGKQAMLKLKKSKIAVFGIGGVGGFVVEGLVRSGIENFTLVDHDEVTITNLNRQIIATHKSLGLNKVDVMKDRIKDINPNVTVQTYPSFYNLENADEFDLSEYDYVIDAIDTISSKLLLVERANRFATPIISSMGCANKLEPEKLEVTDIYKTSVCPLAKVMRKELKVRGIKSLKVIYSKEQPIKPIIKEEGRKQTLGSVSFVPSVAGLIIASQVIKDLVSDI